jgi:S-methylmethionine-dependent homocysteine/selenocysteine methylase
VVTALVVFSATIFVTAGLNRQLSEKTDAATSNNLEVQLQTDANSAVANENQQIAGSAPPGGGL